MAAIPYRSAIEDSTFSPEIKAKVAAWHVRGAELIAQLDALLSRRQGMDVNFERDLLGFYRIFIQYIWFICYVLRFS
jgi:hypothetical protein